MGKQKKRRLKDELRDEVRAELMDQLHTDVERGAGPHQAGRGTSQRRLPTAQALGVGALGAAALMLAAENRERLRPIVIRGLKEVHRFKDWLESNFSSVVEDLEDMSAEAKKSYEDELAEHMSALDRERELVVRLQDLSKRRSKGGR